ncbi:hypothetical protein [Myroides indicus]|uniref:Lipoprotein n=1 Tax=Myroides indicus TaxID=1323422 RepID=A0A4R7EPG3_9FLAO|nr:hypothetical protein [Myroides indicus]TDS53319.1 hypothetical protein C8P70_12813 [Myroides indicus]
MKKILFLVSSVLLLVACSNKQMQITRASFTVEEGVDDHSPIYFEEEEGKMHLNEANRIAGTNYIFSVQRDLNVKEVLEEVQRIKSHKYTEENMHNDEKGVFFSYADTLHKSLAFFPFKNIEYSFERPKSPELLLYVNGSNDFFYEGKLIKKEDLIQHIQDQENISLGFSKTLDFEQYLQMRIFLVENKIADKFVKIDYIY